MRTSAVVLVVLGGILWSSAAEAQDRASASAHGYSQTFWPNRGAETTRHYLPGYRYEWYFDEYYGSPYYTPDYQVYLDDSPYSYYPPPVPVGTYYGPPLHVGLSIGPPHGSRILWPLIGAGASTVGLPGAGGAGAGGAGAGGAGSVPPGYYGR